MATSRYVWSMFLYICGLFLLINIVSMIIVPRGTATWYVAQIGIAFLLIPFIGSLLFLFYGWEPFD